MIFTRIPALGVSVVDEIRGIHPKYVFTYRGHPVTTINNSAWKRAREKVGLSQVRVHDLRHTFGRRLRAAGVSLTCWYTDQEE